MILYLVLYVVTWVAASNLTIVRGLRYMIIHLEYDERPGLPRYGRFWDMRGVAL